MNPESGFSKVTREGIERNIIEALAANDIDLVNAQLDIYPTGRPRPDEPYVLEDRLEELE